MLWRIFRKTNLCDLRFRSSLSIDKGEIFMIFSAKTQKSTFGIRKVQSDLNLCKVNVSFHHLDCEQSLEALTCVILGSAVVWALTKVKISHFSVQKLKKALWAFLKPRVTWMSAKLRSHFIAHVVKNLYKHYLVWFEVQKWLRHWEMRSFHDLVWSLTQRERTGWVFLC